MKKLTRTNWLDAALQQLAVDGYTAVAALPLSKLLGVTRGSFYYHFESVEAFHAAVIQHWTDRTTVPLIHDIDGLGDPHAALESLLLRTLRSGEVLERAIRSWASIDTLVAEKVDAVDQQRIDFAQGLLVAAGIRRRDASTRAKLLYWAAIGRLMLPHPASQQMSDAEIMRLSTLMTHDLSP